MEGPELYRIEAGLRGQRRLTEMRFETIDRRFEDLDWRFKDMQWHIDFARKRYEEDRRFARGQRFVAAGFLLLIVVMSLYEFLG